VYDDRAALGPDDTDLDQRAGSFGPDEHQNAVLELEEWIGLA
jgi:hypothetical protein